MKQQIALANPLYLTQVGWIYHTSAPSGGAGEEGRIWSSTPAVKEAEAFWIVGITKIYPSSMHAQIIGHSLRF